ncbi:NfeD family protein [Sphingomonas sp. 28-63-12]|uniref:NfeD family protein n=1 Tax=Sphingomonas sp. 28-63-12 TaxID=1970434 RepID=UPI000BD50A1A|nr:MAG: hypothetical protein B7Y47_12105 [Sphingomonas sp. 28-63-12]
MLGAITANAGLLWLAIAILLGGAELLVPGVFLVFLAIAAAITGVAVFALPVLPPLGQLACFAVWSTIAILIGRRWYFDFPVASSDPLLNDRAARLIGDIVTVVEPITEGEGRVKVGDGVWTATGADAPEGARLQVTGIHNGKLIVEPQITLS